MKRFNTEQHAQPLQQLKENWPWLCAYGVSMMVLGALALVFASMSTLFSMIYLGALLIVIGIFEALQAFKMHLWKRMLLHAILAVVYTVAGVYIIMHPESSAVSLTFFIAAFFAFSGIFKILFPLIYHVPHGFMLILSGILTLLVGLMIWQEWPASGHWVIGMFIGIDTMFTGFNWTLLALSARKL